MKPQILGHTGGNRELHLANKKQNYTILIFHVFLILKLEDNFP